MADTGLRRYDKSAVIAHMDTIQLQGRAIVDMIAGLSVRLDTGQSLSGMTELKNVTLRPKPV